ncbi:MAG: hypothetical protein MUF51_10910 [Vicinamibacteria bacterium]|jgi:hypothetical protein|nr:hypothetical protein [Vicinamibacteria bacterium]
MHIGFVLAHGFRVACLALLNAPALPQAAPAALPLTPGRWWEYEELLTEKIGPLRSTSEARTRFEIASEGRRRILRQFGGFDPGSGPVETGANWIRLGPWTGEQLLPLPLEVGAIGPASDGMPGWHIEAEEEVEVPAGRFRALRCTLRTDGNVAILWIAPTVGVIREQSGPSIEHPEMERRLVKWSGADLDTEKQTTQPSSIRKPGTTSRKKRTP